MKYIRQLVKTQNIYVKQKINWKNKEKDLVAGSGSPTTPSASVLNENLIKTIAIQHELVNLRTISDEELFKSVERVEAKYVMRNESYKKTLKLLDSYDERSQPFDAQCVIECRSPFRFERHLFNKLSALVQSMCQERIDWSDAIVARHIQNAFFRIRVFNPPEKKASAARKKHTATGTHAANDDKKSTSHKSTSTASNDEINAATSNTSETPQCPLPVVSLVRVEIKAARQDTLNLVKQQMLELFIYLSNFYPGLYFRKVVCNKK